MREISWLDTYIPNELRMALGDLVIVAAGVESSAYAIARIYRIADPQSYSAKSIIGKLEARVGDHGIPPWSDVERKQLIAWTHAARLRLQMRDVLVHASVTLGGERPDGKSNTFRWSLRDNAQIDSEAHHVERLVRLLLSVRRAGIFLEHNLLYPAPDGGRLQPEYVTFGRVAIPAVEVPAAWSEWAQRAALGASPHK